MNSWLVEPQNVATVAPTVDEEDELLLDDIFIVAKNHLVRYFEL